MLIFCISYNPLSSAGSGSNHYIKGLPAITDERAAAALHVEICEFYQPFLSEKALGVMSTF